MTRRPLQKTAVNFTWTWKCYVNVITTRLFYFFHLYRSPGYEKDGIYLPIERCVLKPETKCRHFPQFPCRNGLSRLIYKPISPLHILQHGGQTWLPYRKGEENDTSFFFLSHPGPLTDTRHSPELITFELSASDLLICNIKKVSQVIFLCNYLIPYVKNSSIFGSNWFKNHSQCNGRCCFFLLFFFSPDMWIVFIPRGQR